MSDQLVKLAIKNNVATITLNRPEVRNALNDELTNNFIEHLKRPTNIVRFELLC